MGIKGEPSTPDNPAQGMVWSAILDQIDHVGSQSAFVSVNDTPREQFGKHPWSIGGGGAAELKELIDESAVMKLESAISAVGIASWAGLDDVYACTLSTARRKGWEFTSLRTFVVGDAVRDWMIDSAHVIAVPYNERGAVLSIDEIPHCTRSWWLARRHLETRILIGGTDVGGSGKPYYEWVRWINERYQVPMRLVLAFVATHNHFVMERGGHAFNRHAPIIMLPATATEDDHLALLGLLNSSTGCFWMQQTLHDKGGPDGGSSKDEKWHDFYEFSGTQLEQFPLPGGRPLELSKKLDSLAQEMAAVLPAALVLKEMPSATRLAAARAEAEDAFRKMIALQEELDWECYQLYELIDDAPRCENPPPIKQGQRAFEIAMARDMKAGTLATKWFSWLGIEPITEIPSDWPQSYRALVEHRIQLIEDETNIRLIENVRSKRRWEQQPWDEQQERALRVWLLDRLEGYFDLDGRMNDQKTITARGSLLEPRLTSVASVADLAKQDKDFMRVAELYAGRLDFDVANFVGDLITAESVPCLPVMRYTHVGLDKRTAWERTWELQRVEDAMDALFEVERLKKIRALQNRRGSPSARVAVLQIDEQVKQQILADVIGAAGYVAEAAKQKLDLTSELILKPVVDAATRAKQRAVGDIPVPPKYNGADFLSGNVWRLRGKLDVPKERWVSFPYCEGEDGTLDIAWAGYDHLQLARAIAERYEQAKEYEGRKLVPLLACIGQLIPWLKQWHNELDPAYGARMGDYFESYLTEEAKAVGMSVDQVMAWTPPAKANGRGKKKGKS